MARRKSRRKRRKRRRTRRYNKRRRRRTRRRRRISRRRGGMSVGMNTVNLQIKAKHAYASAEAVRQKDKGSISWEKGDGKCYICGSKFGKFFGREHHCRSCGKVVCNGHSKNQQKIYRWALYKTQGAPNPFRECDKCLNKENEAIQKVSAENENLAIAALRRVMFENCKNNSNNRKELIENCRHRYPPRLPSTSEIDTAKMLIKDAETKRYLGDNWTVRKQINKIYKPKKKEEEKETDIVFGTTAIRALGLNSASRKRFREMAIKARGNNFKQRRPKTKKLGNNIPTAVPVGQQYEFPEAEVVELGNRL